MMRYLKNMEKEIIIDNKLDEIAKIAQFIEELGMSLQLPSEITMSINLAIEEAISNIIRYAYPTGKSGEITLRTNAESNALVLKIIDDGISFDPTSKDTPEILEPLETRLTKGLGLFLIRRTMDIVEYRTIGSENHLILTKKINLNFKPEASMKTNLCQIEGVTILAIEGRLDTFNASEFNTTIQPLLADQNPNIIINCEGMSYISSSGLRSFIMLQKSVQQHKGQLIIEAIRPEIKTIFDMTGCSSVFTIR